MPDISTAEKLRAQLDQLTPTERRAASMLLSNYPVAGLESITQFARRAGVGAASILRLLGKLGFSGYPEFQDKLRAELAAQLESPLGRWQTKRPGEGGDHDLLARFANQAVDNILHAVRALPRFDFEAVIELLANERRPVTLIGGRFTGRIAGYLFAHLRAMRPDVHEVAGPTATWPDELLNIGRRHVVVVFDVRRYQPDLVSFAEKASERGAKVVLFTDEWQSPVSAVAHHVLAAHTTSPFGWDSMAALLTVVEAVIAGVSDRLGGQFAERMKDLEALRRDWRAALPE